MLIPVLGYMGTSKRVPEKGSLIPTSLVFSSYIRKPVEPTKPRIRAVFVAKSKFFLRLKLDNQNKLLP
jgi:hypothetical protein